MKYYNCIDFPPSQGEYYEIIYTTNNSTTSHIKYLPIYEYKRKFFSNQVEVSPKTYGLLEQCNLPNNITIISIIRFPIDESST